MSRVASVRSRRFWAAFALLDDHFTEFRPRCHRYPYAAVGARRVRIVFAHETTQTGSGKPAGDERSRR